MAAWQMWVVAWQMWVAAWQTWVVAWWTWVVAWQMWVVAWQTWMAAWRTWVVAWWMWVAAWAVVQVEWGMAEGIVELLERSWRKTLLQKQGYLRLLLSCEQMIHQNPRVDVDNGGSTMHMLFEASSKEPLQ